MLPVKIFTGSYLDEKMYLLYEDGEIIMIDSIISQEADEYLRQLDFECIRIILTHEHIDHIYGVNHYKEQYNCEVICSHNCAVAIQDSRLNLSAFNDVLFGEISDTVDIPCDYTCTADTVFEGQKVWNWKNHQIIMTETPGHSKGGICIMVDGKMLFTGDVLQEEKVATRLPGGSKKIYKEKTVPYLRTIPLDVIVYSGHYEERPMAELVDMLSID